MNNKKANTKVEYIKGVREELLGIEDNVKSIDGLNDSQWVAIRAAHRLLGEYLFHLENMKEDENFLEMLILHFNYLIDKGGDSVYTYKTYKKRLNSILKGMYED